MKKFDILSTTPSLYLFNQNRGKSKIGAFISILYILSILFVIIYYFYIYFSGKEFTVNYSRDIWGTSFTDEDITLLNVPKYFILFIKKGLPNIEPIIYDANYNHYPIPKDPNIYNGFEDFDAYQFNLSFFHLNERVKGNIMVELDCIDNCKDNEGRTYFVEVYLYTNNLKISNEKSTNPLLTEGIIGDHLYYQTADSCDYKLIEFTPIKYETTQIFNSENKLYINSYLTSFEQAPCVNGYMARLNTVITPNNDYYFREYTSFLDTVSNIGGLFSTFQTIFSLLLSFYSDSKNNFEITKNILIKKHIYKKNMKHNLNLDNNELNTEFINEKNLAEKKIKISSFVQFMCGFCCFGKNLKTQKIMNLCDEFVSENLSVENIIFNNILFEMYYKSNPFDFTDTKLIKDIEKEMNYTDFNYIDENENLKDLLNDT